ncbi:MAG: hypothetical protein H6964_00065 [Chromatiaceae bacterium]|nr:hypothetical protein [Gammaproteobacteria bacterium]MCB1873376.1 hypothetical protein [Gammaproteobacteria bacterium]MCB1880962.1 hypothetical protein [Gammaproteobacteria bacterium]MCB1904639.1 hypothetical protein [Gammaproteobacteria bacterium]MCP5445380.1 hypothetical protein [Chromatiaceae bacterium]
MIKLSIFGRRVETPAGNFRRILLFTTVCACVLPSASLCAQEDGRYRAIVLHEGGASINSASASPKVFILDSRDGHMWTWEQNAWTKDAKGDPRFGTTTIYQGRLKVGSRMGEVVEQSR